MRLVIDPSRSHWLTLTGQPPPPHSYEAAVAQHFLASKAFRDLSLYEISQMTDEAIRQFFQKERWGCLDKQGCPDCGVFDSHKFRAKRNQWRCKACEHEFSVTSATIFADRKMPLRKILMGVCFFAASANAISAIELANHLSIQPKSAAVLLGKLKEVVLRAMDRSQMEGIIEVDGGHFGGKPRRSNFRKKSKLRDVAEALASGRLTGKAGARRSNISELNKKKLKNRRIIMPMRVRSSEKGEGAIRTYAWVGKAESDQYIRHVVLRQVKSVSIIVSDEGPGFSPLSDHFETEVVPYSQMYCTPEGVNQNQAESFMSRVRRMEATFHGFHSPIYQADYAAYAARLEDDRRKSMKQRVSGLLEQSLNMRFSAWWRGYWQGKRRGQEILCDDIAPELCFPRQNTSVQ